MPKRDRRRAGSEKLARRRHYRSDMFAADLALEANNIPVLERLLNYHIPIGQQEDLRGFEWYYLWRTRRISPVVRPVRIPTDSLTFFAVSANGRRMAVGSQESVYVAVWNLETNERFDEFGTRQPSVWGSVNKSPFLQALASSEWLEPYLALSADGGTLAYPRRQSHKNRPP